MNTDKSSIENWWKLNPMTYGSTHGQLRYEDSSYAMGTTDFYDRLDQEFYSWNKPLHGPRPFSRIFPYDRYVGRRVLEIGCGIGTMIMNWAKNGSICTAVDLNQTSIEQTTKRFGLLGLKGEVLQADANKLPFENSSFDFVYSWGVLHHSPNLSLSIDELFRVLKPGGGFGIMLYNRASLYQWYMTDYVEGFLHNERSWLSRFELNNRYGDGHKEEGNPYTQPITKSEGLTLLRRHSTDATAKILGTDLDCVFRLLLPGVGKFVPKALKKPIGRRWGWSLWFYGSKD